MGQWPFHVLFLDVGTVNATLPHTLQHSLETCSSTKERSGRWSGTWARTHTHSQKSVSLVPKTKRGGSEEIVWTKDWTVFHNMSCTWEFNESQIPMGIFSLQFSSLFCFANICAQMIMSLLLYSHTDSLMKSSILSQKTSAKLRFTKNLINTNINRWALNITFWAFSSLCTCKLYTSMQSMSEEWCINLLRISSFWNSLEMFFHPKPLIREVKYCLPHMQALSLQAIDAKHGKKN